MYSTANRLRIAESEMIGKRFGLLEVVAYVGIKREKRIWKCKCHGSEFCKQESLVTTSDLGSGRVNSCGCLRSHRTRSRKFKHGNRSNPAYNVWVLMNQRCGNAASEAYQEYGGRGIIVCERWRNSNERGFENFLADMGERPADTTIDRINNDGNYEPGNCRWASRRTQRMNQREGRVVWLTLNGKTQCMMDWAKDLGIDYRKIAYHLKMKKSFDWIARTYGKAA